MVQNTTKPSKNFYIAPNTTYRKLSANAFMLYHFYMAHAGEDGKSWFTNKKIAEEIGISLKTLKKAKKELIDKGYILSTEHTQEGVGTIYSIVTALYPDANESWKEKSKEEESIGSENGTTPGVNITPPPGVNFTPRSNIRGNNIQQSSSLPQGTTQPFENDGLSELEAAVNGLSEEE
ncbi:MAG: helix-turn-helix domain-containing protein, partial [Chlorobi bacterium]|nr:helix-turn-helix domain-containing protein [Chlorobiota bacterium]